MSAKAAVWEMVKHMPCIHLSCIYHTSGARFVMSGVFCLFVLGFFVWLVVFVFVFAFFETESHYKAWVVLEFHDLLVIGKCH